MKEIPVPFVRFNQAAIVIIYLLSLFFMQPLFIIVLWLIQTVGFLFGSQAHLFMIVGKLLLKSKAKKAPTESSELVRFNNAIAVVILSLSSLFFVLGLYASGFIVAGVVFVAASFALLGKCFGCFLYYQFKQWKIRTR